MRRIFKYQLLTIDGPQPISMPRDASVLTFQYQPSGGLCLWAIVDDEDVSETREFVVVGTGHQLPLGLDKQAWIGTTQQPPFVRHCFEVP